jgi:acetyltransferase-like isoleucine patch superfamily enzyme
MSSSDVYVHPLALVESDQIGAGTRVWAFAHVMAGARVGRNCNICDHAFVETGAVVGDNVTLKNNVSIWAGVTIEDDVFVGPNATFTNDRYPRSARMREARDRYSSTANWLLPTIVERGASIGASATLLPGIRAGRYSMIAAGSVATSDIEPFALMIGAPARLAGYVCRCGQRLANRPVDEHCERCRETLGALHPLLNGMDRQ